MAVYQVTNQKSALAFVEFTPQASGNFCFFTVRTPEQKDAVKAWLTSAEMGQEIIGETALGGQAMLVARGEKSREELMKALEAHGDPLALYQPKIPFTEKAWKTGAKMAFVGQGMQLTSGFLRPNRKIDWAQIGLAVPNLIATTWILLYGAQRSEDTNRLAYLKEHFNDKLAEHSPGGIDALPDVDDRRSELHKDVPRPPTFGDKVDGFMKRHSVDVGEIGLRYMGAFSLAFKPDNWGKGLKALSSGGFRAAYDAARTVTPNASPLTGPNLTHFAGLLSLAGKTVALSARTPDPYDPEPRSWLDRMREKYTFRLGGWMETLAFGSIAADGFINKKISFKKGGKPMIDFISGIGGTLFTIRYAIRHWAPFGIKEMNMDEMYAHVIDGLATLPPEKLPALLAQSAADITEHFKEKRLSYGDVYVRMMDDLYRYHHIAVDHADPQPEESVTRWRDSIAHAAPNRIPHTSDSFADAVHAVATDTPMAMST